NPDDGLQPFLPRRFPEVERAERVAVLGHCDRSHSLRMDRVHERLHTCRPVQHRVLTMYVQVREPDGFRHSESLHSRIPGYPLPGATSLQAAGSFSRREKGESGLQIGRVVTAVLNSLARSRMDKSKLYGMQPLSRESEPF